MDSSNPSNCPRAPDTSNTPRASNTFTLIESNSTKESDVLDNKPITGPILRETYLNDAGNYILSIETRAEKCTITISFNLSRGPIDFRDLLESSLRFADHYFLTKFSDPNFQLYLELPALLVNHLQTYYPDFQSNFQIPLTRFGYLPKLIVDEKDEDDIIIRSHNHPNERTPTVFRGLFGTKTLYQKISPDKLWMISELNPRTALIYLYYGDNTEMINRYLYSGSRRPRTRMSMLGGLQQQTAANSLTLTLTQEEPVMIYSRLIDPQVNIGSLNDELRNQRWIPLTRYGAGMKRGQYMVIAEGEENRFCGTFYYYEPDSNFFLSFDQSRFLVADNKYSAIKYLLEALPPSKWTQEARRIQSLFLRGNLLNLSYAIDTYRPEITYQYLEDLKKNSGIDVLDLFMTGHPIRTPDGRDILPTSNDFLLKKPISSESAFGDQLLQTEPSSNEELYAPYIWNFYAVEDDFDQPLCHLGKEAQLDVIILTKMVGSGRTVVEILDTRTRDASFKSIYEIIG